MLLYIYPVLSSRSTPLLHCICFVCDLHAAQVWWSCTPYINVWCFTLEAVLVTPLNTYRGLPWIKHTKELNICWVIFNCLTDIENPLRLQNPDTTESKWTLDHLDYKPRSCGWDERATIYLAKVSERSHMESRKKCGLLEGRWRRYP